MPIWRLEEIDGVDLDQWAIERGEREGGDRKLLALTIFGMLPSLRTPMRVLRERHFGCSRSTRA